MGMAFLRDVVLSLSSPVFCPPPAHTSLFHAQIVNFDTIRSRNVCRSLQGAQMPGQLRFAFDPLSFSRARDHMTLEPLDSLTSASGSSIRLQLGFEQRCKRVLE
jgi:hypothetical protein